MSDSENFNISEFVEMINKQSNTETSVAISRLDSNLKNLIEDEKNLEEEVKELKKQVESLGKQLSNDEYEESRHKEVSEERFKAMDKVINDILEVSEKHRALIIRIVEGVGMTSIGTLITWLFQLLFGGK
ncbi:hypothetical protein RND61_14980 [Streptomyces sp. TRM76323]|uniref:DUF1640 domain-containing protein n=1 Tax=Streptomyces tamarix TaxID=3078565 RepID=A0ABU3QKT4_9ACTN|nr:hypothetical protein [Streptomyces tamarix]MDT9683367.1 hypothetical protein [Streptomyces tamarix]